MKKVGYFFLCFVPLILSICLQVIVSFPVMGISAMVEFAKTIASGNRLGMDALFTNLYSVWMSKTVTSLISICFSLSCIVILGLWYKKQFLCNSKPSPKNLLKPGVCIGILLMVPGLQMISSILTTVTAALFPGWMDFYEKLMESSGLTGDLSFLLILYAVLLGPIGEEFIFRGVTLASAKRALPFWAANLFQALLFGVFHMNVIQGIYAFFIGLFLGYVCEKGGSIYHSIFLHILFNAWGTLMPTDSQILTNPLYAGIFLIASILIGILGLILFNKNTLQRKVNVLPDSSDM